jgi:hypothetical protein
MTTPVLKTKHRSVGPRKGVGNGFQPDAINPSKKRRKQKRIEHENEKMFLTLGDVAHGGKA